jgi:P4 family phage/plasmid primase-like protien
VFLGVKSGASTGGVDNLKIVGFESLYTARFMRGNWFDYVPTFKLVFAGNTKPRIKNVDEAIKRRFHLVPFNVTIPPEQRDLDLGDKLKAEWPGILKWMLDGCIDWQERGGLCPPESVTAATNEYFESQDTLMAWLADCCDVDPTKADNATALYESWANWADRNRERPGSQRSLADKLKVHGFEKHKTRIGIEYVGLAVRTKTSFVEA